MLRWIAVQVNADPGDIEGYAKRDPTRREHFIELLQEYGWQNFGLQQYREMSAWLMNQARSTDLGMALISELRHRRFVVPVLPVLEQPSNRFLPFSISIWRLLVKLRTKLFFILF